MSRRRRVFLIFGALLLIVVVCVGGWIFGIFKGLWPPPGTELRTGIVFGQGGGQELKLNFVRPKKAAGKMPVLLFIHGGGWQGGKKEEFHPFTASTTAVSLFAKFPRCDGADVPTDVEPGLFEIR